MGFCEKMRFDAGVPVFVGGVRVPIDYGGH